MLNAVRSSRCVVGSITSSGGDGVQRLVSYGKVGNMGDDPQFYVTMSLPVEMIMAAAQQEVAYTLLQWLPWCSSLCRYLAFREAAGG